MRATEIPILFRSVWRRARITGWPSTLPNPKGKAERKPRKQAATITAGDNSDTVGGLYPCGKRLLGPERNLGMAHAPRIGGDAFLSGLE